MTHLTTVSGHSAKIPQIVLSYFGEEVQGTKSHPIITAEFKTRWTHTSFKKRVSRSWARKLKAQGVTYVTLTVGDHSADFSIDELVSERKFRS